MDHRYDRLAFGFLAWACVACGSKNIGPPVPATAATSVDVQLAVGVPAKIDLLFLIDNSSSMADKQDILAQAVPDLVSRLVDPVCVDPMTGRQVGNRNPDGSCSVGELEFNPIEDIHVGMITSSLGGHGAVGCATIPIRENPFPTMTTTAT